MAFDAFERMMAWRYLRARRKEGFVSVIAGFSLLGIGLGVATLIIVMAVMNGFRQELIGRILGLNGHLSVYEASGTMPDYPKLIAPLSSIEGVVSVAPVVEGQVMASANGAAGGALVRGMHAEDLQRRATIADHIVDGSLKNLQGDDVVMIGQRMAQRYGLQVGSQISLISPKGNVTAFGSVPRVRSYTVAAIFNVGMYEYDSSFIYMPLEAAQTYFRMDGGISHLEVMVKEAERLAPVIRAIQSKVGSRYLANDWTQSNSSFFNALQVERNVMFLILTLIILVAAFNIISGLIMLVKDKGRDIAILRTMGASRGSVMRIFFLAGASVGVFGTLFGVTLGLAFAENIEVIRQFLQGLTGRELFSAEIYFLSTMPAKVDYSEVLSVVGMAVGLSLAATLYPSWRAARLDPVEALRYE
ncbi:lipoprotein-releasing ABC transporter permease subunit [Insolitispirillum peregrinum]|uniref:Lipoprotein-releasing system permease protein n=1 Tax=Insolitispirillum peregrinum TaxID=80876 RepID=A0A1N7NU22_9PROT|nr:lipoprotein-releasing ABC transporter permease subunit [Insolitispirillum peregrinum]SIT01719.1 lipoprotein-releasing system permease protein [Insolitispirillum peregrinum]